MVRLCAMAQSSTCPISTFASETPKARAKKLIQDRIDTVKEKEKKKIEMTDPAKEPNYGFQIFRG
jgi:predicted ATPase with chaperone activity